MMSFDFKFDYQAALKRENFTQGQIDAFRESLKNIVIVPKSITNKQLLIFLHACDGNKEKAKQLLEKHYEIRKKAPQLFTRRDATNAEIRHSLDNQNFLNLPPTPGNHLVCLHALSSRLPKNYVYNPSTTCFLMMIFAAVNKHGPSNGLVLIFDMKNFTAGHLLRNNLRSMKRFFEFIQEGSPLKIHEIHILNTVPFFHLVMAIIKPFLKPEIAQKMHLHSSTVDLDELHAKYIPRTSLPSDFGGICDSVEVLHEKMCKELLEMRDYFIDEEKQAALEFD